MRIIVLMLALSLASAALAKDKYRGPALVWDSVHERYRELTTEEARFFNMARDMFKAKQGTAAPRKVPGPKPKERTRRRDFEGTDEQLDSKLGIASDAEADGTPKPPEKAGEVENAASGDYKLEIDTMGAVIPHSKASGKPTKVKVGASVVAYRFSEHWKANVDVAEQFLGGSINFDGTSLLRPSVGAGVGTELDGSWVAYAKASFRTW